jgi:phage shock protein A
LVASLSARCAELEEALRESEQRMVLLEGDAMAAESEISILRAERAALTARHAFSCH